MGVDPVPITRATPPAKPFEYRALIDGELIGAKGLKTIDRSSPAHNVVVGRYPAVDLESVHRAAAAARRAESAGVWRSKPGSERAKLINRVAALLDRDRKKLGLIESLEGGKPIALVDGEIQASIDLWEYAATLARHSYGDTYDQLGAHTMGLVLREPIGVVGMITPWNFPLLIVSQKLPFALALGCCAVIKPSEMTSGATLLLGELLLEAGLPRGVVNIVPGFGADVGRAICESDDVDMISFTGSTRVGKDVCRYAAATLKKVSLELGGKSAHIVCADADLDRAVAKVVTGATFNTGQCCVAGSRLLVEAPIADEFCARVADGMGKLRVGDPLDRDTRLGPLVSQVQFDRVKGYIDEGRNEGAQMHVVGDGEPSTGFYVRPTLFSGVEPKMRIAQEEIFGPVLSVIRFDTPEEAVEIANSTLYGLAAGVWTTNVDKAFQFARALKAGTVEVNAYMAGAPELPLTGHRQSGIGHEKGRFAVDEFTKLKTVQFEFAVRGSAH